MNNFDSNVPNRTSLERVRSGGIGSVRTAAIAASFLVLSSASALATNLVVGGGFESPVIPPGQPYLLDAQPFGWTGIGDLTRQGYAGAVSSGNGNQWFDLNPDVSKGNGIYQYINLNAGQSYAFSFEYNGGGGGSTTEIFFSLGSVFSGGVSTAELNVYGGTPWQVYSYAFVSPVSGPEKLDFMPNGVWSGGFIDNVQLDTVPLPASILSLGAALAPFVGIGLARARRSLFG